MQTHDIKIISDDIVESRFKECIKISKMERLTIEVPKGFMNTAVTTDNFFIADTNDSANWDTLKIPLPRGKWSIYKVEGKSVILEGIDQLEAENKRLETTLKVEVINSVQEISKVEAENKELREKVEKVKAIGIRKWKAKDIAEAENKELREKIDKALKIIKGRFEFTTYENIRKLFLKP